MMATIRSQEGVRQYAYFTDQHGRRWGGATEDKTRQICGEPEPQFKAPLMPPTKFIRHDATNLAQLIIDYDGWEWDTIESIAQWEDMLREEVRHRYDQLSQDAYEKLLLSPPEIIRTVVGPKPEKTAVELIQACRAKNPWALGFSDEMPAKAAKFMEREEKVTRQAVGSTVDPFADDDEVEVEADLGKYPAWKGLAGWELSDGSRHTGIKKPEAIELERALQGV